MWFLLYIDFCWPLTGLLLAWSILVTDLIKDGWREYQDCDADFYGRWWVASVWRPALSLRVFCIFSCILQHPEGMHPAVLWSSGSFLVPFMMTLSLPFQIVSSDFERGGRSRFTHLSLTKTFPLLPILRGHELLSKGAGSHWFFAWPQYCAVRNTYTHTFPGSFKKWNGLVFHIFLSYFHKCLYLFFWGLKDAWLKCFSSFSFFLSLGVVLLFPKLKCKLKTIHEVRMFSKLVLKGLLCESVSEVSVIYTLCSNVDHFILTE